MNRQLLSYGCQLLFSLIGKLSFLGVTLLLFKALPQSQAGIFAFVFAVATIMATISECGMRGLLVREMSRMHAEPEQCIRLLSGVLSSRLWTLFPYLFLGLGVGLILLQSEYWFLLITLLAAV